MNPNHPSFLGAGAKQEPEINLNGILIFAAIILALVIFALATVRVVTHRMAQAKQQHDQANPNASITKLNRSQPDFPEPREQPAPHEDLRALQSRENAQLNSYGWITRQSGVIHIPIERAMQLIAEHGLPVRSPTNNSTTGISSLQLQQQRPLQSTAPEESTK